MSHFWCQQRALLFANVIESMHVNVCMLVFGKHAVAMVGSSARQGVRDRICENRCIARDIYVFIYLKSVDDKPL